jgi:O-antigen ligase
LAYYSRRLILPAIAVICLTVATVPQIQTRLLQSSRDFFIAGGRSEMWEIGIELAAKYPLGIGYQNSPILQKYDPNIPAVHNHFHSNILNVLVETGWLGLMILGLWVFNLVIVSQKFPLSFPNSLLIKVLSASIISWQIAGLVEYNFGDSEVFMVVLIVVATIAAIVRSETDRSAHPPFGQKVL